MTVLGIEIIESPAVPLPGWIDRRDASEIRMQNEEIICMGGRLIDCDRPSFYFGGFFMVNIPREMILAHPDTAMLMRKQMYEQDIAANFFRPYDP